MGGTSCLCQNGLGNAMRTTSNFKSGKNKSRDAWSLRAIEIGS